MQAQDWLAENYPDKETWRIDINQQLEGVLDCREYKKLEKIFISTSVDRNKFEIKKGSYQPGRRIRETKITSCRSAQTYLNQKYPTQQAKAEIKRLYIWRKGLEGDLDLTGFTNLEELECYNNCLTNLNVNNCQQLKWIRCWNNQLTTLNLSNLEQLEKISCHDNYLTQIVYPTNPEKITHLSIRNNNLNSSDLTIFSPMRNLKYLGIGNTNKNKINQNIYNRWVGSCESLKDLNKLENLYIENTDLTSGLEYLPVSLKDFSYKSELRPDCQLAQVSEQWDQELWKDIHQDFAPKHKKDWLEAGFNKEQTKEWINIGLTPNNYYLAEYLKLKDYAPNQNLNISELREKYQEKLKGYKKISERGLSSDYPTLHQRWKKTNQDKITKQQLQDQIKLLENERARLIKRNSFLEELTAESKRLIKEQKEKIITTHYHSFTEEEKEELQKLIKVHRAYMEAKKTREETDELYEQVYSLRKILKNKLGTEFIEAVESVLTDLEDLYQNEWNLQKQLAEKEQLPNQLKEIEKGIAEISNNIKLLEANPQQVVNTYITTGDVKVERGNALIGNSFGYNVDCSYNYSTNQQVTVEEEYQAQIQVPPKK